MKKLNHLIVCFCLVLTATAQQVNDPNAVVREARGYHGISVSHSFDVYLSQGSEEAVAVSAANSKDRDMITVEVKDGILYIGMQKGLKWNTGNKKLRAYISFKELDKLTVSGACDVFLTNVIKSAELSVSQSGASDLRGKVDVERLTVNLSGASDMLISGRASQLSVDASGASDFKGFDLVAEICDATASGASDIRVTVNKELSARASGASDVKYKGNGVIRDLKSSGASSVSKG
jgi:Putative auto-transporter adhesin, head GIN domain